MKDSNCQDKIFSGEEEPTSEKFLDWLNNLSDEAIAVDARLADWFSLSIFDYHREQKLTVENKEADWQVFQLIKRFLTGSALRQVEASKAHRSGRTCLLDLIETHVQDFSGEAARLEDQLKNLHFSEDSNPTNEILRVIAVVSKLSLVQQHRNRPGPDIHDICLKIVKALQPYSVYSEIKLAESINPAMPELHDLYQLRTWCNIRYKLWAQNGGRGAPSNKRSLCAMQGEYEGEPEEDYAELCAFQRHAGGHGKYFKKDEAKQQQKKQPPYKPPPGPRRLKKASHLEGIQTQRLAHSAKPELSGKVCSSPLSYWVKLLTGLILAHC